MKREWNSALTAAALTASLFCGLVYAQMEGGAYSSGKAAQIGQTGRPDLGSDAIYSAGAYASVPPELAAGEGRPEVQSFCMTCHSTRYITMQPVLPASTWETEVNKMIKSYGAPIPDETAKKITAYLQAHYSVEQRKE